MSINGDVDLPGNATATVGQTSLLGSLHVELAPPTNTAPEGRLHEGSVIALSSVRCTRQRSRRWRPCRCCSTVVGSGSFKTSRGRSAPVHRSRGRPAQPDPAAGYVSSPTSNDQTDDITAATDSLNNLVGQFAAQKPVVDKALKTIPDALAVLKDQRGNLTECARPAGQVQRAGRRLGQPDEGTAWSRSSKTLGRCWNRWPTPARRLTRSLDYFTMFPYAKSTVQNGFAVITPT